MRVLMSAPNVLILDEPTNDLDIQTLPILEDYLDHFDGIIITVSHDRYFLDRIVNRTFSFEGDGKIRQFEGGYSDYLIRKELEGLDTEMSLKGHAAATEGQSKKGEKSHRCRFQMPSGNIRMYRVIRWIWTVVFLRLEMSGIPMMQIFISVRMT